MVWLIIGLIRLVILSFLAFTFRTHIWSFCGVSYQTLQKNFLNISILIPSSKTQDILFYSSYSLFIIPSHYHKYHLKSFLNTTLNTNPSFDPCLDLYGPFNRTQNTQQLRGTRDTNVKDQIALKLVGIWIVVDKVTFQYLGIYEELEELWSTPFKLIYLCSNSFSRRTRIRCLWRCPWCFDQFFDIAPYWLKKMRNITTI